MNDSTKYINLASQFRNPTGQEGLELAKHMSHGNLEMIKHAFKHLNIKPLDFLVELGPGFALHLKDLLIQNPSMKYLGLDHSEDIVKASSQLAQSWNNEFSLENPISFLHVIGDKTPLQDGSIDKFMTVNTLYFMDNPANFLNEVYRILKKEGVACFTFALPEFLIQLPFTEFGFRLYEISEFEELCNNSKFNDFNFEMAEDQVLNPSGNFTTRKFVSFILKK